MVGVAPKASVHAELNHEWRSKAFDEALRAARDWHLDSSTASKVCTLGDGACRHFVAFYVLTLNVSRAHRGPARARIELMGRRPTTGLSTLNNIFTSTLKGAKYVQLLRYVNVRHDMTSHFSCPFENGNGTDRSCDSCDSCGFRKLKEQGVGNRASGAVLVPKSLLLLLLLLFRTPTPAGTRFYLHKEF